MYRQQPRKLEGACHALVMNVSILEGLCQLDGLHAYGIDVVPPPLREMLSTALHADNNSAPDLVLP
jgi:hypothetical protein